MIGRGRPIEPHGAIVFFEHSSDVVCRQVEPFAAADTQRRQLGVYDGLELGRSCPRYRCIDVQLQMITRL